ncbi:hypothetical protein HPB48_008371 [Haemaphysalis longicornis]|uniref:Uncharacterized protein n=1 Tax=Haemaphysalis longicornis TaxID=44386 RepID=A0A9J6FXU3_HAELO|nr:hypothetical protein HPB48_008371 [Haemaphysalis longicornis]
MKDLMQAFKVEEDMGLFLGNFERTSEKVDFPGDAEPQSLLTLLPSQEADVVAAFLDRRQKITTNKKRLF